MGILLDSAAGGGYGWALLQALLALAGVAALCWFVLRWAGQRGLGKPVDGRIEVLERRALDARSAVSLVRVEGRTLLLGHGEGSAPRTLADLTEPEESGSRD